MDQHTFEKRAISSKKYTYLQYSLASALSKSAQGEFSVDCPRTTNQIS